jgi:hypothetical protein
MRVPRKTSDLCCQIVIYRNAFARLLLSRDLTCSQRRYKWHYRMLWNVSQLVCVRVQTLANNLDTRLSHSLVITNEKYQRAKYSPAYADYNSNKSTSARPIGLIVIVYSRFNKLSACGPRETLIGFLWGLIQFSNYTRCATPDVPIKKIISFKCTPNSCLCTAVLYFN